MRSSPFLIYTTKWRCKLYYYRNGCSSPLVINNTYKGEVTSKLLESFGLTNKKERSNKNKSRKEILIEFNNNERKEEYLHWCHSQCKHHSCSPMKLFFDLNYIKKNKNLHLKEKEKSKLNLYRNLFYSQLNRSLFCLQELQYF